METFHDSVGLGVIGSGVNDLAPQKCHQVMPESRGELPASISGNGLQCFIATHKMQHQRVNHRLCCDVWKRNSLRPARKTINDGEYVMESFSKR